MAKSFLLIGSVIAAFLLAVFSPSAKANVAASSTEQADVKPVVTGLEGQRAFDDLAKCYASNSGWPNYKAALAGLKSHDTAAAQRAGNYLLALFEQSFADESNGRAQWLPTPFTNEGPGNRAHDFRLALAKDFGDSASSQAALPAALWLIENDPIADDAEAGVHVLARIHSETANDAFGQIIRDVHPNQEVLVTAIKEAESRHLISCKEGVVALEQSYRKAVRDAAVQAVAQLGETNPIPYDPLKAFSPRITALLKLTLDRILTPVPANATWLDGIAQPDWNLGKPYPVHGWLVSQTDKSVTYLDVFGRVRTVPVNRVQFTPGSLAQTAQSYADLRVRISDEAHQLQEIEKTSAWQDVTSPNWRQAQEEHQRLYHDMDDRLKEMTKEMQYIGPPGDNYLNLPEMTVAAWCWHRGDLASAAAVLFPCYDAARDDRWLDWSSRDPLANQYDLDLLQKFTVERDYPPAQKIAALLGSPAFDGYVFQARSRELAAQLAARAEDFTTLTLPSADAWQKIKAGLGRAQQITWLASRLKLMHCINPGWDEIQFASAYPGDNAPPGATEVINPYLELINLNLTPDDLLVLAPFAADKDYLPSYRFYKDWIPWRGLCRVSSTVGSLINTFAGHEIVHETDDGVAFEPGTAATLETDLRAWIAAHHGDTPDKLLAQTLRTSNNLNDLKEAAIQALRIHHVEVLETLAVRMDSWVSGKDEPPVGDSSSDGSLHLLLGKDVSLASYHLGDMVHLLYGARPW